MTRPLRLEFPGALYHVTSRGDRRGPIYRDHTDRQSWLEELGKVCSRFNFVVHAYCEMTNHYHLVVETVDGNLARGIRQLNGAYSQLFNRRHSLVGHVFQGRYKAILVQKESYLLELARYVVLNPVRAGMVAAPEDWAWSSYTHFMNSKSIPGWLEVDWLLSQFGANRQNARREYNRFVLRGIGALSPLRDVKHQILLGDKEFIAKRICGPETELLSDLPRTQRRAVALPLAEYASRYCNRDEAMARAYNSMAHSMAAIALHFQVSTRTVGRAVKQFQIERLVAGSSSTALKNPG